MKQILNYLESFFRAQYNLGFFISSVLLLLVFLILRYGGFFHPDFLQLSRSKQNLAKLFFYAIPYFGMISLYSFFYGKSDFWFKPGFWGLSLVILGVLYLNQYAQWYQAYIPNVPDKGRFWYQGLAFNLHSSFFYLSLPFLYAWYSKELNQYRFYGCSTQKFKAEPYLIMLLVMLPLLIWASYQADFLRTYPRYRPGSFEVFQPISPIWTIGGYELSYILQFISLEIFFRGFIVLALGPYLGAGSIFPMVGVYAFLHFYKPLAETIGSIFGGLILGIIAWKTQSVFGGMLVHIGVALMMEALAFWQLYGGKQP